MQLLDGAHKCRLGGLQLSGEAQPVDHCSVRRGGGHQAAAAHVGKKRGSAAVVTALGRDTNQHVECHRGRLQPFGKQLLEARECCAKLALTAESVDALVEFDDPGVRGWSATFAIGADGLGGRGRRRRARCGSGCGSLGQTTFLPVHFRPLRFRTEERGGGLPAAPPGRRP